MKSSQAARQPGGPAPQVFLNDEDVHRVRQTGFVPLGAVGGIAPAKAVEKKEEVGSFGD